MNRETAVSSEDSEDRSVRTPWGGEGLARAVYAAIILTALLVALREHTESASDALAAIIAAAGGLLAAHTYADVLAKQMALGRRLRGDEARELLIVESQLLIAAAVPVLLFVLAEAGTIGIDAAFQMSFAYTLASLFVIGTLLGRSTGRGIVGSLIPGAAYAGLGIVIIAIEAGID
jgi:hypothetical protein